MQQALRIRTAGLETMHQVFVRVPLSLARTWFSLSLFPPAAILNMEFAYSWTRDRMELRGGIVHATVFTVNTLISTCVEDLLSQGNANGDPNES